VKAATLPEPDSLTSSAHLQIAAPDVVNQMFGLRRPPPKTFAPPTSRGTSGINLALGEVPQAALPAGDGLPELQAVIVGLNPSGRLADALPEGSRLGEFARAPNSGDPSSGASSLVGVPRVPGLLAHHVPGKPADDAVAPTPESPLEPPRTVLREIRFPNLNRTMSAPLRPSSRVIPAGIEARFVNRNVYTLVIPVADSDECSGDWVLWFAEHVPREGAPRISAPVPARRYVFDGAAGPQGKEAVQATFQLAATIDHQGHISSITVVRGSNSERVRRRAVEELQRWEFQPALRNSEAIDVDIVVQIPFQFR
jgi:TonB family protein